MQDYNESNFVPSVVLMPPDHQEEALALKFPVTVNHALTLFEQNLTTTIDTHAPIIKKRIKRKRCPWLLTEIKKVMDDRDRMLRKARSTNKDSYWSNYK